MTKINIDKIKLEMITLGKLFADNTKLMGLLADKPMTFDQAKSEGYIIFTPPMKPFKQDNYICILLDNAFIDINYNNKECIKNYITIYCHMNPTDTKGESLLDLLSLVEKTLNANSYRSKSISHVMLAEDEPGYRLNIEHIDK